MTAPENFCRFFKNGLVYNNDTTHFTIAPCCYFKQQYQVEPDQPLDRRQWLTENITESCSTCIQLESSGLHSFRQSSFEQTTGDTDQVEYLTVAVNKKCNLACPSCDAGSSSFWYQENLRNNIVQPKHIHELHQEDRAGLITDRFIDLLAKTDLSKLKYIKFGGGEPLMSDTHEKIMQLIPNPDQVTVHYTSNFSIMPSKTAMELWKKFKLVKWVASIDGTQDQFEFLRWPYPWAKLESFISTAKSAVPGNVMFGVEHTLNPLNVYYLDQFETWFNNTLDANQYGDKSDINLHPCLGTLDLKHTPPLLRNTIATKYGADHPVVRMLEQNPYSGSTAPMVKYLDQISQQRNLQWRAIFPEIEKFLNA